MNDDDVTVQRRAPIQQELVATALSNGKAKGCSEIRDLKLDRILRDPAFQHVQADEGEDEMWLKADVEMKDDPRLLCRPEWERWLWLCLNLLAKQYASKDGILKDFTPALLRSRLVLSASVLKVEAALVHYADAGMVKLGPNGEIELLDFVSCQGAYDPEEQRDKWRTIKKRQRGKSSVSTKDTGRQVPSVPAVSTEDMSGHVHFVHPLDVEVDVDVDVDKEEEQRSASAPAQPSLAELEADWPKELLARVKQAITSTRKSGEMREGPWRAFLLSAKNFSIPIRVRASEQYLDRAYAADGKNERYLLGIMRGEHASPTLVPVRNGAASLGISEQAKREHEVPGRKFLRAKT